MEKGIGRKCITKFINLLFSLHMLDTYVRDRLDYSACIREEPVRMYFTPFCGDPMKEYGARFCYRFPTRKEI